MATKNDSNKTETEDESEYELDYGLDSDFEFDSNYNIVEKEIGIVFNNAYGGFDLPTNIKKSLVEKGVPIKEEHINDRSSDPLYYIRDNKIFADYIEKYNIFNLEVEYIPIKMHREGYWDIREYDGLETVRLDHENFEKHNQFKKEIQNLKDQQNELINNLGKIILDETISAEKKIENMKMLFPINEDATIDKILSNFKFLPGNNIYNDAKKSFENKKSL
jgi:hypothetical protein